ncbi:hypothetical protein SBRY_50626 [Actinacidiphila bryophytorum]|uniref:Uncharacterized protein n=1 Tax=Actinacidiphila bryophytorum TaxID=1436133 RepID=A0A9W4H5B2_9ACTN|nr:hypothetical protein SBRY_50626 [Actinacidiphila bryophytorum]
MQEKNFCHRTKIATNDAEEITLRSQR